MTIRSSSLCSRQTRLERTTSIEPETKLSKNVRRLWCYFLPTRSQDLRDGTQYSLVTILLPADKDGKRYGLVMTKDGNHKNNPLDGSQLIKKLTYSATMQYTLVITQTRNYSQTVINVCTVRRHVVKFNFLRKKLLWLANLVSISFDFEVGVYYRLRCMVSKETRRIGLPVSKCLYYDRGQFFFANMSIEFYPIG